MTRTCALAVVLFAWTMLGADDCALTQIGKPVPLPAPKTSPPLPWCEADPPVGCAAVCVAVDDVELTSACANVGADVREMDFQNQIQSAIDARHAQNLDACNAAQVGMGAVTPCQLGLPPLEYPGHDHETCSPPPAACIVVVP